jgi:hypothetical protein
MSTVFLSAAKTKTQQGSEFYRTFHSILANSVGPEYAIHEHLVAQIHPGDKAVGFDRDQPPRAEGVAVGCSSTGKTFRSGATTK